MAEPFSVPRWLARNPLGIIALFISLIYAMSALLLGTTVSSLTTQNQTVLVVFLVSFPVLILGVFAWLVSKHHKKLYGPGDFRTDAGFLSAGQTVSPHSIGQRLLQETETANAAARDSSGTPLDADDHTPVPPQITGSASQTLQSLAVQSSGSTLNPRVTETYLLEGLVFQELQRELDGSVVREVEVEVANQRVRMDGVVQSHDELFAIEVDVLHGASRQQIEKAQRLRELFQLDASRRSPENRKLRLVQVFVLVGPAAEGLRSSLDAIAGRTEFPIHVRVFTSDFLLKKYGLL
jgi:hypothetical protein